MTIKDNHYKERKPIETINIIENFFKSKGLTIKNTIQYHSEADTYSCNYSLFFKHYEILSANGKGMTKLYSKASCYAELYERFCAYNNYYQFHPIIRKYLMEHSKKNNNYYFSSDEKIQQFSDDPYSNYYSQNTIFKTLIPENFSIVVPYISLDKKQQIYRNYETILGFLGTTGLAAGNTIEEALVQGTSEIFERLVIEKFFQEKQSKYYYIDNNILDEELQDKINNIINAGYEIKIYDLSYNFNLPVCMLFMCNINTHRYFLKFGAAPVFNIAVERCITEIYQGINNFNNHSTLNLIFTNDIKHHVMERYFQTSIQDISYIPDFLLLNSQMINKFNTNIFLNKIDVSNEYLLSHVQYIINLNNIELFYRDISMTEEVVALHIIIKDLSFTNVTNQRNNLKTEEYFKILNLITNITTTLTSYCLNKQDIQTIQNDLFKLSQVSEEIINNLFIFPLFNKKIVNLLYPYSLSRNDFDNTYKNIYFLLTQQYDNISFSKNNIFKEKYELYVLYLSYKDNGYSDDLIIQILKTLNYHTEYILKDFDKMNVFELIKYIFIDTLYEIYHSQDFYEFLNIFIN